jgi:hypothetical protein
MTKMATTRKTNKKKKLNQFRQLNVVTLTNAKAECDHVHVRMMGKKHSTGIWYEGIAQLSPGAARILAYSLLEASERAMDVI